MAAGHNILITGSAAQQHTASASDQLPAPVNTPSQARLLRRQLPLVHQGAGGEGADVGVVVVDAAHAQPVLNQLAQHVRLQQ